MVAQALPSNIPPLNNAQFRNAIEQLIGDKMFYRLATENELQGMNAWNEDYIDVYIDGMAVDALSGMDGLDGFFSKIRKKIRAPMRKIRKKLGIKTPKIFKKIESGIKKVGRKIDQNKEKILGAAVLVGGAMVGGPAILGALQSAGGWGAGMLKVGAAKIGPFATGMLKKVGMSQIVQRFIPGMSGPVPVDAATGEIVDPQVYAQAQQAVSSPGWLQQVRGMVTGGIARDTGISMQSRDAQRLLDANIRNEQKELIAKLQREKVQAIRDMKRENEMKELRTAIAVKQSQVPPSTGMNIKDMLPLAVPIMAAFMLKG